MWAIPVPGMAPSAGGMAPTAFTLLGGAVCGASRLARKSTPPCFEKIRGRCLPTKTNFENKFVILTVRRIVRISFCFLIPSTSKDDCQITRSENFGHGRSNHQEREFCCWSPSASKVESGGTSEGNRPRVQPFGPGPCAIRFHLYLEKLFAGTVAFDIRNLRTGYWIVFASCGCQSKHTNRRNAVNMRSTL